MKRLIDMNTVIRHPHTGFYLSENGKWTRRWTSGKCFESSIDALDFCQLRRLWEYQILLKHPDDDSYDIVVGEKVKDPSVKRAHVFHA